MPHSKAGCNAWYWVIIVTGLWRTEVFTGVISWPSRTVVFTSSRIDGNLISFDRQAFEATHDGDKNGTILGGSAVILLIVNLYIIGVVIPSFSLCKNIFESSGLSAPSEDPNRNADSSTPGKYHHSYSKKRLWQTLDHHHHIPTFSSVILVELRTCLLVLQELPIEALFFQKHIGSFDIYTG